MNIQHGDSWIESNLSNIPAISDVALVLRHAEREDVPLEHSASTCN